MHNTFMDLVNEIYNLFVLLRDERPVRKRNVERNIRKIDKIWGNVKKKILRTFD